MSDSAPLRPGLVRDLSSLQAACVVIGNVIGSAIFLVPAEMMRATGSPGLVSLAWVTGALIAACGALTYAELAAMRPVAGAEYVFLRDAFGPVIGFLCAWTSLSVGAASIIAAFCASIIRVLYGLPGFAWLGTTLSNSTLSWGQLAAIAVILCLTALNYVGVRRAARVQVVATGAKVVLLAFVALAGLLFSGGSLHNFASSLPREHGPLTGFSVALVAALWAYEGWSDAAQLAGEIRDPQRSVPRAIIGAIVTVTTLYILVSTAVLYAFPASHVSSSPHVAADILGAAFGPLGLLLASLGIAFSLLVAINSAIMSQARVPYAVSRDGYFFAIFGRAHPRFHTPGAVLILQAMLASALVLFGGTYQELFSLVIFAAFLFYLLNGVALFVFRIREPGTYRPFKVPGYPVTPAIFIITAAVMVYFSFVDNLRNSLIGCMTILAGLPVYFAFAKRKELHAREGQPGAASLNSASQQ